MRIIVSRKFVPLNWNCNILMISIPIVNAGKTRIRFSQLFIPGNKSDFIARCARHSAHSIILNLEDSVAPSRKDDARLVVQRQVLIVTIALLLQLMICKFAKIGTIFKIC